ncbi:hypothetical protein PUR_50290 [Paenibacillus sp. URB8-2]|nr:hypothetical protein PUR_50290 [Paenibacillus sp. URB8-2]
MKSESFRKKHPKTSKVIAFLKRYNENGFSLSYLRNKAGDCVENSIKRAAFHIQTGHWMHENE